MSHLLYRIYYNTDILDSKDIFFPEVKKKKKRKKYREKRGRLQKGPCTLWLSRV